MHTRLPLTLAAVLALAVGTAPLAADAPAAPAPAAGPKPEQLIKWRQSAFQVIAWNSGRIKASLDGTYNKDDVARAANALAALANAGLGSLFAPGSETGKGWHDTTVKPAFFSEGPQVAEAAGNFAREATELNRLAALGDPTAVRAQYGKLTRTCKACHDAYKNKD